MSKTNSISRSAFQATYLDEVERRFCDCGVDELLNALRSHRSDERVSPNDPGGVVQADVFHPPGGRLHHPGSEPGPVDLEHLGEADRADKLDRLSALAVGKEEEAEVCSGQDGKPHALDGPEVFLQRREGGVRLLRSDAIKLTWNFRLRQWKTTRKASPRRSSQAMTHPEDFFGRGQATQPQRMVSAAPSCS